MIGPTNFERLVSLALALSIQVAIGWALFAADDRGEFRTGGTTIERGAPLAVTLVPLEPAETLQEARRGEKSESGFASITDARHAPAGSPLGMADAPSAQSSDAMRKPAIDARAPSGPAANNLPSDEALAWRGRVETHLARYRLYPPAAASEGQQGVALIQFTVDRNGRVGQVWIAASSGVADIDRETIAAILRAQPLPVFPAGWPDRLDVRLPVSFRLG